MLGVFIQSLAVAAGSLIEDKEMQDAAAFGILVALGYLIGSATALAVDHSRCGRSSPQQRHRDLRRRDDGFLRSHRRRRRLICVDGVAGGSSSGERGAGWPRRVAEALGAQTAAEAPPTA